jgi:hypothetical protein
MDRLTKLRDFAVAWEAADTVADAATATGLSSRAASNLAAYMRRRGVMLKKMPNLGNIGSHDSELTPDEWLGLRRLVEHAAVAREIRRRYRCE